MPEQDPWEEAAKNFKGQTGAPAAPAAAASGNDDWKLWTKGAGQPAAPQQPGFFQRLYENTLGGPVSLVQKYGQHIQENSPKYGIMAGFPALGQTALDVGNGITDSFTNAASKTGAALKKGDIGHAAQQAVGMAPMIGPSMVQASEDSEHGNYGAAAGDVLGFGASMAAPQIMKGAGRLIAAPAEPVAETALGVRGIDRRYSRSPGKAIINETSGYKPSTIADEATAREIGLSKKAEDLAKQSEKMGIGSDLTPARNVLDEAAKTAGAANSRLTPQAIAPMQQFLKEPNPGFAGKTITHPAIPTQQPSGILGPNGQPIMRTVQVPSKLPPEIASIQSPVDMLHMKRQFGKDYVDFQKHEVPDPANEAGKRAYHELGQSFLDSVPSATPVMERMSDLAPVAKRAGAKGLNAGPIQLALGKIAAPTGALASTIGGAMEGGRHFGVPGAIAGGIAGIGLPALIASPTAQMIAARALNATGEGIQAATPTLGNAARIGPLIKTKQQTQK